MDQLFLLLDSFGILEEGLRKYLEAVLKPIHLSKKQVLLREGAVARYIGFIEKGVIRSYRQVKKSEMTIWLMREGDIFASLRSFFLRLQALETIEALEPCIIHAITHEQYLYILKTWPSFNLHRAEILQKYYLLSEEREIMREQDANVKFGYLMKHYPDLIQREYTVRCLM
ncbi:MAG: cyclic nucleotide-binding domain-containing protein [Bacteroidetes bacterium]|nr:cyclic nucleotide-binding domain-containing protein [Bacteroidota bacterium]